MSDTYVCEKCKKEYPKGSSDEEMLEEKRHLFPKVNVDDCAVICDDCWKAMGFGASEDLPLADKDLPF